MGALAHHWHWTPVVLEELDDRELEVWFGRLEQSIDHERKAQER